MICLCVFANLSGVDAAYFSDADLSLPENLILTDRHGEILRFFPSAKGERFLPTKDADIPDSLKKAVIAIEDELFYDRNRSEVTARLRAIWDWFQGNPFLSELSTLTGQTAYLIRPYSRPHTLKDRWNEISMLRELEKRLTKKGILEQYLNRVPQGPGIVGVGLAARLYFDRKPSELSLAQVAILATLPRAPSFYNPYGQHRDKLLERKDVVLSKMLRLGFITNEQYETAKAESIFFRPKDTLPNHAPHVVGLLKGRKKLKLGVHRTTIDLAVQKDAEQILASHKIRLKGRGAHQAATMIVRNRTMEVLSFVGSIAYSAEHGGFNNGATARRSAGSALKPFLYAAALEQGHTASSLLEDVLRAYKTPQGFYSPDNFDQGQYGPVTLRSALGNSLNVSAVKLLATIRLEEGFSLMNRLRLLPRDGRDAWDYGLGLAVGNAEVTLEGLVTAYAALANRGKFREVRYWADDPGADPEPLFSSQTAYIVTDILSDPSSRLITFGRALSFPFKVAVKTGTSTAYRDSWAVGYTPEYTVGVWVGNFEGHPTDRLSGASGAAPILKDLFRILYGDTAPSTYGRPSGIVDAEVCGISGMRPGPACDHRVRELFLSGTEPDGPCGFHRHETYYHKLPAAYAGWLYERNKRHAAGSFRLAGFSTNLESLFGLDFSSRHQTAEMPVIRVHYPKWKVPQRVQASAPEQLSESPKMDSTDNAMVRIVYPLPDDHFICKEGSESTIKLESRVSRALPYIDWFVDGSHKGRTGPPYSLIWELERGRHHIMAVGPDHKGDGVEITVE